MQNKKAQSEMVGFAVILIIVTVLLVVFLSFSANDNNNKNTNDYKIMTFLESFSETTTLCEESRQENYVSLRKVISKCKRSESCYNNTQACEIMNETIDKIMNSSWKVGLKYPDKGYSLKLKYGDDDSYFLEKIEGIKTKNNKIGYLEFPSDKLLMQLEVYN